MRGHDRRWSGPQSSTEYMNEVKKLAVNEPVTPASVLIHTISGLSVRLVLPGFLTDQLNERTQPSGDSVTACFSITDIAALAAGPALARMILRRPCVDFDDGHNMDARQNAPRRVARAVTGAQR